MASFPDLPSDELAAFHANWSRTRTVVAGSQAVKRRGREFLPPIHGQTEEDYQYFKQGVTFLPMAASVEASYLGLMFRKQPVLEDGGALDSVKDVLTRDGMDVEELSKWVSREVILTNWCGLLIDQAAARPGLSLAEQLEAGERPYIAPYTAENILDIRFGVVRGRRLPLYVRLKDSDTQVRHLNLVGGIYTVQVEEKVNSAWVRRPVQTPVLNGQPLNEIPFVLVTLDRCTLPRKAPIEDIVELNCNHYVAMGRYEMALLYAATPIKIITGFKPPMQEVIETIEGTDVKRMVPKPVEFDTSPNAVWVFGDKDTKAENLEYSGNGIKDMRQRLVDMEDKVSELSGGFWTREKAAAEAAETHRLRLSTQNAKVANMANSIAARMEVALEWMARWLGADVPIEFSFNTDYLPMPMTSSDLTAQVAANKAGKMSDESLFYSMRDRMVFDQALTWEEEQRRRADDQKLADARALEMTARGIAPVADTSADEDEQSQA